MVDGRRGRHKPKVAEADPADVELFASFVRSEERKERDAKKAARDERRAADELGRLVKAKEDAAAQVKRLRGSDRATAEQKAEADSAYKVALAAVVAAETGESPAWAPEPAAEPSADAAAPTTVEDPPSEDPPSEDQASEAPTAEDTLDQSGDDPAGGIDQ